MCRTPIAAADSAATSTSEKPSRSNPVVNVIRSGLYRLASAAIAVESMPPDRNAPTVTSARMCLATESSITAAIRWYSAVRCVVGGHRARPANTGWKYRFVAHRPARAAR